jgi:hypothetical protein
MKRTGPTAGQIATASGLAVVVAAAAAAGLSAVAKPSDYAERLAAVERSTDEATALLRQRRAGQAFGKGAVCIGDPATAAERLRYELTGAASSARLEHPTVTVMARPASGRVIAPMEIRLEAAGGYDAALTAIDRMSNVRPVIFIDSVDIVSKTSFVTLAITGRAYCSAARSS